VLEDAQAYFAGGMQEAEVSFQTSSRRIEIYDATQPLGSRWYTNFFVASKDYSWNLTVQR
jgi:hypothetical protein